MTSISIFYNGREYVVGYADAVQIRQRIDAAVTQGRTIWVEVNHGEGRLQPAEILVGPAIPISISPIPEHADDDDADGEAADMRDE